MIINIEREPKYSLYYIGYMILRVLDNNEHISIEKLYEYLKNLIDKNLHIDFLYYSLDWLFMLSLVNIVENQVIKC